MSYGNHLVTVRRYVTTVERTTLGTVISRTTRQTIDSPSFLMGGVAGQAMDANAVVSAVVAMVDPDRTSSLYVNGEQATTVSIPDATSWSELYINVYPTED